MKDFSYEKKKGIALEVLQLADHEASMEAEDEDFGEEDREIHKWRLAVLHDYLRLLDRVNELEADNAKLEQRITENRDRQSNEEYD